MPSRARQSLDATPRRQDAEPMSDYEIFLARAEAEERVHRERMMKYFKQREAAMAYDYTQPATHQQKHAGGSAPPTAPNARGGSRRRPEELQHRSQQSSRVERIDAGKRAEMKESKRERATAFERQGSQQRTREPLREMGRQPEAGSQQPQTLRRQTSIAQRIAQYVRPAREPSGYDDSVYRSASKSGGRKGLARTQAFAAVAE